ncbi:MAG: 30S ribosome-binding factor RbfA [Caldisericia bacterium]|jgi:ribosome-binding factor A|nr:30S ribosome-binding factor RbfA [Caldisericia bacterium]MDD3427815.1 30S ribosome-binding factor RbfA [Caldisericia bacterium]MDD5688724.1 30S ribosome-binding factor RbfA [Caldisericia bacterium]HOW02606.1 30S ribosome-binding factor RbfA [Caldisericia bacterium]
MNRKKDRLEHTIRTIISDIFLKEISDPRIGFITVSSCELSSDLKHAKIFVSIYGDEKEKEKGMKGVKSATKYIQELLSKRIRVKNIPLIEFVLDESIEKGIKLTKLIEEIEKNEPETD